MKQYYVFINEQQEGPLTIDELSQKKITKETKVWFEGMSDWKSAGEIEELKSILNLIPPPINSFNSIPPKPNFNVEQKGKLYFDNDDDSRILGIKKVVFFEIVGVLVLILGYGFIKVQATSSINEQQKTEIYNIQLEQQQKEIEEQNNRIAEQERIEAERVEKERIEKLEKYEAQLNETLNNLYNNLRNAQSDLNNVTGFKLLRSASERNNQINQW